MTRFFLTFACTAALLGLGCASDLSPDPVVPPPAGDDAVPSDASGVRVQTRFVIEGTADLGEEVHLDALFVHVGALFLEPLGDDESVTYANREPFALEFDLENGRLEIDGPSMRLPQGGAFAVAVQIEPSVLELDGDKGGEGASSVEATGHWYHVADVDLEADDPTPLPWMPKSLQSERELVQHLDFVYRSDAVARIQLDTVEFDGDGEYELVLTFRVDDWLEDSVLPALRQAAAERTEHPTLTVGLETAVEIEGDVLDDTGLGVEGLVGDMNASAHQAPR